MKEARWVRGYEYQMENRGAKGEEMKKRRKINKSSDRKGEIEREYKGE